MGKNSFQTNQDALINAVFFRRRRTSVGESTLNQGCVPCLQIQLGVIQLQMKLPLENVYDLKERMPVVGHGVSRMDP